MKKKQYKTFKTVLIQSLCICMCLGMISTVEAKTIKKSNEVDYQYSIVEINQSIIQYANENNIPIQDNGDIILNIKTKNTPSVLAVDDGTGGLSGSNITSIVWNVNQLTLTIYWSYAKAMSKLPKFKNVATFSSFSAIVTSGFEVVSSGIQSILLKVLQAAYGVCSTFIKWYYKQLNSALTDIRNAGYANRRGVVTTFKVTKDYTNLISCTVSKQ